MFTTSTTSAEPARRPSLARSVWTDMGGGWLRCNPALTNATIPELRHPEHARRRLAALTVREISPSDAARVDRSRRAARAGSSPGTDTPESTVGTYGIGGLDGVGVATLISDALTDPRDIDDALLTDRIIDAERLARFAAGARAELVAEFARRRPGDESTLVCSDRIEPGSRWAPDELGLALDLTRLNATAVIGQSLQLATVLPDTLAALRNGQIDERRAEAICSATLALPLELARRVEAIVLPAAPGRTLRQVRERLYRAVHRVDPDGEYRRHKQAREDRRVTVQARDNGMASMWLHGAGTEVEASFTMLTRLAESLGTDDPRSKDQRRFDLAMQTMQGRLTVTDLDDVASVVARTTPDRATVRRLHLDPRTDAPESADPDAAEPEPAEPRPAADPESSTAPEPVEPEPDDPEPAEPRPVDPDRTDPEPAQAKPDDPESTDPEAALLDAVVAALAKRPQMHDTVRKPLVQVVVGLDTLIGADDRPAELLGYGPITATTARALAADGVWKRLVTDPLSGTLLDHGRTTYKPPVALADHIDARDQHCRFPTCSRRARDSHQDHLRRFEHDGITSEDNLHALCPSHHLLKEHRDWNVLAHPDGRLTWVAPTGHHYTSEPYDYHPYTDPPDAHPASPPTGSTPPTAPNGVATPDAAVPDGTVPDDTVVGEADEPDDPPPF